MCHTPGIDRVVHFEHLQSFVFLGLSGRGGTGFISGLSSFWQIIDGIWLSTTRWKYLVAGGFLADMGDVWSRDMQECYCGQVLAFVGGSGASGLPWLTSASLIRAQLGLKR